MIIICNIINLKIVIFYSIKYIFYLEEIKYISLGIGDWGFGIGGLGFGAKPQTPNPKPQNPTKQK